MSEGPSSEKDDMDSRETAVGFVSHRLDESVVARFEKLQREVPPGHRVFFLYDATGASDRELAEARETVGDGLWRFEISEVINVDYPGSLIEADPENPLFGNIDNLYLHFADAEPRFSRYWFVEYDVAYSGHWSEFFVAFADSDADLLGTTLTPYERLPDWWWWPTFDPEPDLNRSRWLRGFFPVVGLSPAALEQLEEGYRAGWSGHHEAILPTMLNHAGLRIEDVGGDGPYVAPRNMNRFYTNTPGRHALSPGTFTYRPTRPSPGLARGKLWHPVKPDKGYVPAYIQRLKQWVFANVLGRS